jgi:hypothetical protein
MDIEKIKEQLAMKYVAGRLVEDDIYDLPIDDELRALICSFSPQCAYWYAKYVDRGPNNETRIAVCKDPFWSHHYAWLVDQEPRFDTKEAASRDFLWKSEYEKFEIEYNAIHRKN